MSTHYVIGNPIEERYNEGPHIIVHCLSDIGAHDAGFALQIRNKWPAAASYYRNSLRCFKHLRRNEIPGHVFLYDVTERPGYNDLLIASIIGQHGLGKRSLNLDWLMCGMRRLSDMVNPKFSFHLPRIGCGLAGGKWEEVGQRVETWLGRKHEAYVYDLPGTIKQPKT